MHHEFLNFNILWSTKTLFIGKQQWTESNAICGCLETFVKKMDNFCKATDNHPNLFGKLDFKICVRINLCLVICMCFCVYLCVCLCLRVRLALNIYKFICQNEGHKNILCWSMKTTQIYDPG